MEIRKGDQAGATCQNSAKLVEPIHTNQGEFGKLIGTSGANVSNWELGICKPRLPHLRGIAKYTGMTIPQIMRAME